MSDKVPVLRGRIVGRGPDRRARVWCQYCETFHLHSPEPGYRVAHCPGAPVGPESPYKESGYIIEVAGEAEGAPPGFETGRAA